MHDNLRCHAYATMYQPMFMQAFHSLSSAAGPPHTIQCSVVMVLHTIQCSVFMVLRLAPAGIGNLVSQAEKKTSTRALTRHTKGLLMAPDLPCKGQTQQVPVGAQ